VDLHHDGHRVARVRWLALIGLVVGVNLLPAFGPPTWSLLVFASLQWHLTPWAIVPVAALCAGAGRYVLASSLRRCRRWLPRRYVEGLTDAATALRARPRRARALAGLFVLSPLPSAQLFCAAGLLDVRLAPLTGWFMLGRLVTYSLYVGGATAASLTLHAVLGDVWGSPWLVVVQCGLLLIVTIGPLLLRRRSVR
jgi:hypothetical protein